MTQKCGKIYRIHPEYTMHLPIVILISTLGLLFMLRQN